MRGMELLSLPHISLLPRPLARSSVRLGYWAAVRRLQALPSSKAAPPSQQKQSAASGSLGQQQALADSDGMASGNKLQRRLNALPNPKEDAAEKAEHAVEKQAGEPPPAGKARRRRRKPAAAALTAAANEAVDVYHLAPAAPPPVVASADAQILASLGFSQGEAADVLAEAPRGARAVGAAQDGDVEGVCRWLVDEAGVPIRGLHDVLLKLPELLALTPAQLQARKDALCLALTWRHERQLRAALAAHPALLSAAFPAQLARTARTLAGLGMSRAQALAALTALPALAEYRGFELISGLKAAGLDPVGAPPAAWEVLAAVPECLAPAGAQKLGETLRLLEGWGLVRADAFTVLRKCPALLRTGDPEGRMARVVEVLRSCGVSDAQLAAILLGYPPVLRCDPTEVQVTMRLLAAFNVPLRRLVAYPRLFVHDNVLVLGPRLAYLRSYKPDALPQMSLATVLCKCDEDFAYPQVEEFLVFKDKWVGLYGRKLGRKAPAPAQTAMQARLAQEISTELWRSERVGRGVRVAPRRASN